MRDARSLFAGPVRFGFSAVMLVWAVLVAGVGPAWAHGDEEPGRARAEVQEAIALIVSSPDDMAEMRERVAAAQEARDVSGVDMVLVRRAGRVLAAGDKMRARDLLQRSIGALGDVEGTDVRPIREAPPPMAPAGDGHPAGQSRPNGAGPSDAEGLADSGAVSLATGEETGTTVVTEEMAGRGALTGTDVALLVLAGVLAALGVALSFRFRPAHSVYRLRRLAVRGEG